MRTCPPRRSVNAIEMASRADNEVTEPPSDRDTMIAAVFPDLLMIGAGRERRPSQTLCRLLQLGLSNR